MDGGDGTVRLGALNMKSDRSGLDLGPDVSVSSPVTRQKAAAAKQFIENHYKNYLQGLQDRKDRYDISVDISFSDRFIDFNSMFSFMVCGEFYELVLTLRRNYEKHRRFRIGTPTLLPKIYV